MKNIFIKVKMNSCADLDKYISFWSFSQPGYKGQKKKQRARATRGAKEKKRAFIISKWKRHFRSSPLRGGRPKINHFDIINKFSFAPSAKTTPFFLICLWLTKNNKNKNINTGTHYHLPQTPAGGFFLSALPEDISFSYVIVSGMSCASVWTIIFLLPQVKNHKNLKE